MNEARRRRSPGGTSLLTLIGVLGLFLAFTQTPAYGATAPGIKVAGNQIVTTSAGTLGVQSVAANTPVVLRGVNITGSEYECLSGDSVWDSSSLPNSNSDYQPVINAMLSWHVNVVRVPLNEDCWLAINGVPAATSGANYVGPITTFTNLAIANGLIVEVDLHWGAGGTKKPKNDSFPAMDTSHSLAFWESVAGNSNFKNNPSVIFNLTNEPYITSWSCYLDGGCTTPSGHGAQGTWTVQGTQSVVTAIRETVGAHNPIIIAGLDYSNQLNDWLQYVPTDPQQQIIAGIHVYFDGLDCEVASCWTSVFGGIQNAGYPIVIDETGESDNAQGVENGNGACGSDQETSLTTWADDRTPQVGYWFGHSPLSIFRRVVAQATGLTF
jgi:Cellulase (glycosyl hydrolase family 5)